MQNKVLSYFYNTKKPEPLELAEELTFQNFLLLVQLKNHNKLKQKQLKIQQYKQLKDRMQNKIKILPKSLEKSFERYDSKLIDYQTSRRISLQFPSPTNSQIELPKLKRSCNIQMPPHLRKQFRKDEINSIRSFSFRVNPEFTKEKQKLSKPKALVRKFKTDFCKLSKIQELRQEINNKRIKRKKGLMTEN